MRGRNEHVQGKRGAYATHPGNKPHEFHLTTPPCILHGPTQLPDDTSLFGDEGPVGGRNREEWELRMRLYESPVWDRAGVL